MHDCALGGQGEPSAPRVEHTTIRYMKMHTGNHKLKNPVQNAY